MNSKKKYTVGFILKFKLQSQTNKNSRVYGDELFTLSLMKYIKRKTPQFEPILISHQQNHIPNVDIMVYMNDSPVLKHKARKHLLYFQGTYVEDHYTVLSQLRKRQYDGYIFVAPKLYKKHLKDGYAGTFIPFGVDLEAYKPQLQPPAWAKNTICYVGNDFKGSKSTQDFLIPATQFDLALYGKDWYTAYYSLQNTIIYAGLHITHPLLKKIIIWFRMFRDRKKINPDHFRLHPYARGKIKQSDIPTLYNHSSIVLNLTFTHHAETGVINYRIYEAFASGGFVISDYFTTDDKKLRKALVMSKGNEDLVQKIRYYKDHPEKRAEYIQRGRAYVTTYGNIEDRALDLIAYIKRFV
jgi:hypothetical protein